mmetsp:Transcript_20478/g.23628  ORF Transcript_20478/g.23628 Transcript_20478/m.23628 type:complete len:200 (+) Transcript_20478:633-1232(+)
MTNMDQIEASINVYNLILRSWSLACNECFQSSSSLQELNWSSYSFFMLFRIMFWLFCTRFLSSLNFSNSQQSSQDICCRDTLSSLEDFHSLCLLDFIVRVYSISTWSKIITMSDILTIQLINERNRWVVRDFVISDLISPLASSSYFRSFVNIHNSRPFDSKDFFIRDNTNHKTFSKLFSLSHSVEMSRMHQIEASIDV